MSQSPPLNSGSYLTSPVFLGSSALGSADGIPSPVPSFGFPTPYILIPSGYPVAPISPSVLRFKSSPSPYLAPASYRAPIVFTHSPFPHQPSPSLQWVVPSAPNPSPPDSPVSIESTPPQDSYPPLRSSPPIAYPETPSPQSDSSELSTVGCYSESHSQLPSSPSPSCSSPTSPDSPDSPDSPECEDCRLEAEENARKDQTKTSPISRQEALSQVKLSGKLFVGGLTKTTTAKQLKDYFSQFGSIIECFIKMSQEPCESRGFGFVTYAHPAKIEEVLAAGPLVLNGNTLDVRLAIPKHMSDIVDITLGCRKIFVGGLSKKTDASLLQTYFATFGSVQQVLLLNDPVTGRHRGFAFITFEDSEIADRVCIQNPHVIGNRLVECKLALPKAAVRRDPSSPPSTPPSVSPDSSTSSGQDNSQYSSSRALSLSTLPIAYSPPPPLTFGSQSAFSAFHATPRPALPASPAYTYPSTPLSSPFLPLSTTPFMHTPRVETDRDNSYFQFDVASPFHPLTRPSPSAVVLSPMASTEAGCLSPSPHSPSLVQPPSYLTIPSSLPYGSPALSGVTNIGAGNVIPHPSPSILSVCPPSLAQNSCPRGDAILQSCPSGSAGTCPQCLAQSACGTADVNVLCKDLSNLSLC